VNGVAPGGTLTGLRIAPSLREIVGSELHFADRERSEELIGNTNPLRVVAQPEDHADVYLLLASPSSRAITGEIVSSDGGLGVRGTGVNVITGGG
jgi:NAD(P)-dependent dehydrogenase (short-subunit alcohol dehydrogenase family)